MKNCEKQVSVLFWGMFSLDTVQTDSQQGKMRTLTLMPLSPSAPYFSS